VNVRFEQSNLPRDNQGENRDDQEVPYGPAPEALGSSLRSFIATAGTSTEF
jgi:hypothetical protein